MMEFLVISFQIQLLWIYSILLLGCSGDDHNTQHPCLRSCGKNTTPKTCEYHFDVEWYRTLSKACWDCPANISHCSLPHCVAADGGIRAFIAINRQLPGPAIEVCEGDTVVVYVTNKLEDGGSLTIHWHGLHMKGTPYSDGVPMVTQCAILPHNTFRYNFEADPVGTHWYHAHTGLQREDGVYGAVIIRQDTETDPHNSLYDHDLSEHVMLMTEWYPIPAVARYIEWMHNIFDMYLPLSALINGKNRHHQVKISTNESIYTPPEIFEVTADKRYRFRLISAAGMGCFFRVSVDKHNITVIAADGAPVQPIEAQAVTVFGGERYDFILRANQPVGNYWLRAEGKGDCRFHTTNIVAILRYKGATESLPTDPENYSRASGIIVNGVGGNNDANATYVPIHELENFIEENFTNETVDMEYSLNQITFTFPKVPLLSQWEDRREEWFCNQTDSIPRGEECLNDLCTCTHLAQFPYNKVIELTIVNMGSFANMGHPMHLHGNYYRLMAWGKIGTSTTLEEVKKWKSEGKIQMRYKNPTYRDNVVVPAGGYMIIRLKTDNPGLWLFHCHIESHMEQGQGMIFKIGEKSDWPNPPKNFPKCGNYGTADEATFCQEKEQKSVVSGSSSQKFLYVKLFNNTALYAIIMVTFLLQRILTE